MASIQKLMAGKKKVVKSAPAVAATPAPAASPAIKAVAPAPVVPAKQTPAPAAKQAAKPAAKQAPAATSKAPKTAKTAKTVDKSAPKAAANVVITKPIDAQPPQGATSPALEESSETPEYEVAPYCFSVINSEDGRGRKALGRFRDNLRKFYNMDETGLNWRDGPILGKGALRAPLNPLLMRLQGVLLLFISHVVF